MRYLLVSIACILIALALTLPASAAQSPTALLGPQGALFEQALAQAGLTQDDMRFDLGDRSFWGGDKYRLPFFDTLQSDPWKISPYTRKLSDMLVSQANDPATVLISAQSRLNVGIRLGLTGDPLEPYQKRVTELGESSLAVALKELQSYGEGTTQYTEHLAEFEDYKRLPAGLRDAAALIILVLPDALEMRRLGLMEPIARLGLKPNEVYNPVIQSTLGDEQNDDVGGDAESTLLIEDLLDEVNFQLLNTGGTLLALATKRASEQLEVIPLDGSAEEKSPLSFETVFGAVYVGEEFSGFSDSHCLLSINLRGDSHYRSHSYSIDRYPVSILIDGGGNDTYSSAIYEELGPYKDPVEFASGVFSYGFLFDLAGDDQYNCDHGALGFGLFGVGLLYDAAGNDTYTSTTTSQGCGIYGTGILIDGGGNDQYHTYQYGQGYGFTKGVGLLLDAGGDDVYDANDTDIRFGGPQTALHNTSMSQGMGNGRRGDYLDGHSWAGGVGMLVDGGGSDRYSCGLFGQGCSYWYGTGMLVDKGDAADSYRGIWYVQGSGAHFGLSVLQDDGGDDIYWASHNMAQGAGHDWTLSWFEDSGGNDDYTAPNLSLGGGNANGIGIFWDKAGNDVYRSQGVTLGAAGGVSSPSLREFMLNLGVFVDGGGRDTYLEITKRDPENAAAPIETRPWDFADDGKAWTRPGQSTPPMQREYGVGVDAP
jgi:hypothetical protein